MISDDDFDWPDMSDDEVENLRKGRWGFDPAIRRMGTPMPRFDDGGLDSAGSHGQ